ncbi:MAG: aldo/keto reductase [Candidatus Heimdallarchaeota archaeon]
MKYRTLGRTGLKISEISLGCEWLYKKKEEDITGVIKEAMKQGINYFDIIFNFPFYLEKVSKAIKGSREDIILIHHLGSGIYKEKYRKTRSIKKCKEHFDQFLEIMDTDYVDIAFIHFVHYKREFEECWKEGGVKDLALQLKEEGKTRFIGISTHQMDIAIEAAKSGIVDVIMIQVNLANHSHPLRQEMLTTCENLGVGIIAMKPFGGGKLLQKNKKITLPNYATAFHQVENKVMSDDVTSTQCLHYILNQVGISTVVPGASNLDELNDCLAYYKATDEERDYSKLVKDFNEYKTGECVYCNHCQPCQADIDIGPMFRLFDKAQIEKTTEIQQQYEAMDVQALACIECGDCEERCPFDVKVIAKMKEVAAFFE